MNWYNKRPILFHLDKLQTSFSFYKQLEKLIHIIVFLNCILFINFKNSSSLLFLFVKLDKILLGTYVICVIGCTVIKSAIICMACIGLKAFCFFSSICYCLHFECLHYYGLLDTFRAHGCSQIRPTIGSWGHQCFHMIASQILAEKSINKK